MNSRLQHKLHALRCLSRAASLGCTPLAKPRDDLHEELP